MPQVRIPKEFQHTRRKLIAVPETEYRRFVSARVQEREILADLQASLADVRAGRTIKADSIDEAMTVASQRGWLNDD